MSMPKGFSTQKKLNTSLNPYSDAQSFDTAQFGTAQPTSSDKVAQDVTALSAFRLHASAKTAEAGASYPKRELISTAHGGKKGDFVRFELASQNPYFEASILSVPDADTMILACELPFDINTGDEFFILRYATPRVDSAGAGIVTVSPPAPNSSGSVVNGTLTTTAAATLSVPSGAVGFIIMNESTNSNPMRYRIGGTASPSAGVLLESGRDSGYIETATAVSICNTVSSTQAYNILWVIA